MNILTINVGALCLGVSAAFGPQALSTAISSAESRWTDLSSASCSVEQAGPGEGVVDGVTRRCPGSGGARIVATREDGATRLSIEWLGSTSAEQLIVASVVGTSLEWRGHATVRGFEPRAVIASVDGAGYAVVRVKRGETCLLGRFVGPEAAPAARHLADGANDGKACVKRHAGYGAGVGS